MKTIVIAFLSSMCYATLRYNICKDVPWDEWPLYILNKAFALSALLLLLAYAVRVYQKNIGDRRILISAASAFALIHIIISLILLNPSYYQSFYFNSKMTNATNYAILFGAVAFVVLHNRLLNIRLVALMIAIHAALLRSGWSTPDQWAGGLPPMTLIAFCLGIITFITFFDSRGMREED